MRSPFAHTWSCTAFPIWVNANSNLLGALAHPRSPSPTCLIVYNCNLISSVFKPYPDLTTSHFLHCCHLRSRHLDYWNRPATNLLLPLTSLQAIPSIGDWVSLSKLSQAMSLLCLTPIHEPYVVHDLSPYPPDFTFSYSAPTYTSPSALAGYPPSSRPFMCFCLFFSCFSSWNLSGLFLHLLQILLPYHCLIEAISGHLNKSCPHWILPILLCCFRS